MRTSFLRLISRVTYTRVLYASQTEENKTAYSDVTASVFGIVSADFVAVTRPKSRERQRASARVECA